MEIGRERGDAVISEELMTFSIFSTFKMKLI